MTFLESIQTCFSKYATFSGTASRSEYWWFYLFTVIASNALSIFSPKLGLLFSLVLLLPSLAVGVRRLHDTDRSGWFLLLSLVPVIGWIILLVFLVQESRANRYALEGNVYA